jgi:hypothetical protein
MHCVNTQSTIVVQRLYASRPTHVVFHLIHAVYPCTTQVPPPKSPKVPLSELPPDSDDEDQGDHISHDKFNFAGVNKS